MLLKWQLMVISPVILTLAACSSDQEKIGNSTKEFAFIVHEIVSADPRFLNVEAVLTEADEKIIIETAKAGHVKLNKLKASGFQQQSMDNVFYFFRSFKTRELLKDQAPLSIGKTSIENEVAHAALHLGNKKCDFTFIKESAGWKISLIACDKQPY
ncbi:MAG: hypothetical protein IDH49_08630 [Gammaproteobacteria bacterium]|nr:hypothetical protein [Gammaproteobacteria bacterium]